VVLAGEEEDGSREGREPPWFNNIAAVVLYGSSSSEGSEELAEAVGDCGISSDVEQKSSTFGVQDFAFRIMSTILRPNISPEYVDQPNSWNHGIRE
jgi:hypothetical protein